MSFAKTPAEYITPVDKSVEESTEDLIKEILEECPEESTTESSAVPISSPEDEPIEDEIEPIEPIGATLQEGEKAIIEVEEPEISILDDGEIELSSPEDALDIKIPSMTIIAGLTESGKTNLARHICFRYASQVHRIIVMCPTLDMQDSYSFVDPRNVLLNPTEEDVIKLMAEQQRYKGKLKTILVLDDMVGKVKFRSNIFSALAGTGRHFNLTTLVLMQDLKQLPPIMRTNARSVFVTKLSSHSLRECFELSNGFDNYNDFKSYMNKACQNFRIVRLNLTGDAKIPYMCFNPGMCQKFITKKPSIKPPEKASS